MTLLPSYNYHTTRIQDITLEETVPSNEHSFIRELLAENPCAKRIRIKSPLRKKSIRTWMLAIRCLLVSGIMLEASLFSAILMLMKGVSNVAGM